MKELALAAGTVVAKRVGGALWEATWGSYARPLINGGVNQIVRSKDLLVNMFQGFSGRVAQVMGLTEGMRAWGDRKVQQTGGVFRNIGEYLTTTGKNAAESFAEHAMGQYRALAYLGLGDTGKGAVNWVTRTTRNVIFDGILGKVPRMKENTFLGKRFRHSHDYDSKGQLVA